MEEERLLCGADAEGGNPVLILGADGKRVNGRDIELLSLSKDDPLQAKVSRKGCLYFSGGSGIIRSRSKPWAQLLDTDSVKAKAELPLVDVSPAAIGISCPTSGRIRVNRNFTLSQIVTVNLSKSFGPAVRLQLLLEEKGRLLLSSDAKSLDQEILDEKFFASAREGGEFRLKLKVWSDLRKDLSRDVACDIELDVEAPDFDFAFSDGRVLALRSTVEVIDASERLKFQSQAKDLMEIDVCVWRAGSEKPSDCGKGSNLVAIGESMPIPETRGIWFIEAQAVDHTGNVSSPKLLSIRFHDKDRLEQIRSLLHGKLLSSLQERFTGQAIGAVLEAWDLALDLGTVEERHELRTELVQGLENLVNRDLNLLGLEEAGLNVNPSPCIPGNFLVGQKTQEIIIWDLSSGRIHWRIPLKEDELGTFACSRSGKALLRVVAGQEIHSYDLNTRVDKVIPIPSGLVKIGSVVDFDAKGRLLLSDEAGDLLALKEGAVEQKWVLAADLRFPQRLSADGSLIVYRPKEEDVTVVASLADPSANCRIPRNDLMYERNGNAEYLRTQSGAEDFSIWRLSDCQPYFEFRGMKLDFYDIIADVGVTYEENGKSVLENKGETLRKRFPLDRELSAYVRFLSFTNSRKRLVMGAYGANSFQNLNFWLLPFGLEELGRPCCSDKSPEFILSGLCDALDGLGYEAVCKRIRGKQL